METKGGRMDDRDRRECGIGVVDDERRGREGRERKRWGGTIDETREGEEKKR